MVVSLERGCWIRDRYEVEELIRAEKVRHYQTWLDTPAVFEGDAAPGRPLTRQLVALLKQIENRGPSAGRQALRPHPSSGVGCQ
jgi:hypothetical protein